MSKKINKTIKEECGTVHHIIREREDTFTDEICNYCGNPVIMPAPIIHILEYPDGNHEILSEQEPLECSVCGRIHPVGNEQEARRCS